MRTMLRTTLDTAAGNKALADGSLAKLIHSTVGRIKPEAAYFFTENGRRTAIMIFDMKDSKDMPVIAESLLVELNAEVDFKPVMNAEELEEGLKEWQKSL